MEDISYSNESLMIMFRQKLNVTEYPGLPDLRGKKEVQNFIQFRQENRITCETKF